MREELRTAVNSGTVVDVEAEQRKISDFIESSVKELDVSKLPEGELFDWISLFEQSSRRADVVLLATRATDSMAWKVFTAESYVVSDHLKTGRLDLALSKIRNMAFFGGPSLIGHFHVGIRRQLQELAPSKPNDVIAIYDELLRRIHFSKPLTDSDRRWRRAAYGDVGSAKFLALHGAGKTEQAARGLKALRVEILAAGKSEDGRGNNPLKTVEDALVTVTNKKSTAIAATTGAASLIGRQAPELKFDRQVGSFVNLRGLQGKVVVLDFMAHWCGPCKAALPTLAKLQSSLGDKIQLISLTSYYGYFGATTNLSPEKEFGLMKSFIKSYRMDWPVLFEATGVNSKQYFVEAIPHLVVIDKKGVIRKIEVGFDPVSFASTEKLIRSLIGE